MASASLPSRLSYLAPVLEELAALGPDELHEDTDVTSLEAALRERLAGLKPAKARTTLEGDRQALQKWLERPGQEESPGHFILGWLSGADQADWLQEEPPPEAPPLARIQITPPAGFKQKVEGGVLTLKSGPLIAVFNPLDEGTREILAAQMRVAPKPHPLVETDTTVESVRFGDVTGEKFLQVTRRPMFWKRVHYILEGPGGHVMVMLDGGGKDFDEKAIESRLDTLIVEPA